MFQKYFIKLKKIHFYDFDLYIYYKNVKISLKQIIIKFEVKFF